MFCSAWISSSQPLQEPASTSRIARLRPRRARDAASTRAASSASAPGSAAGARSVSRPRKRLRSRILEVMTRVRAIEGLIAERKVGDNVALDRRLEQRPLEPGRVAKPGALDSAIGCDAHPAEDVAAEPFDQCRAFPRRRPKRDLHRPSRQAREDLLDEAEAFFDFADADPDTRIDVSGLYDRYVELQVTVGRVPGVSPRVEVTARSAPDEAAGGE